MTGELHKRGFIQKIDPRFKTAVLTVLAFTAAATPASHTGRFALYGVFLLVLLTLSRPKLKVLLSRFFFLLPLLIFLALSVFLFGTKEMESKWFILWNLTVKTVLVFLCAAVLQFSTSFTGFLKGLESIPLPRVIPALLGFAYRYVFLFTEEVTGKIRAWRSRRGDRRNVKASLEFIRHALPGIFLRTVERSDRIYAAMLSRGYAGRIVYVNTLHAGKYDWMFALFFFVVLGASWIFL